MDSIVKQLIEGRRIDEVRKKVALDSMVDDLSKRLSSIKKSHHKLSITPNYEDCCVEVNFEGTGDSFRVYPQKTKISNDNSNKVIKVDSIDGAYIDGTDVYDADGNLLGSALIRMKAIHNKSDYSTSLDDAEYRFNSKITDLRRLEKYVAREDTTNMN